MWAGDFESAHAAPKRSYYHYGVAPGAVTSWVGFFLALHDLGKFGHRFQGQVPTAVARLNGEHTGSPIQRSARLGRMAYLAADRLPDAERREKSEPSTGFLGASRDRAPRATAVYESPRHQDSHRRAADGEGTPAVLRFVDLLPDDLLLPASDSEPDREALNRGQRGSWWIAGLAVLADWLGSNTTWFAYVDEPVSLDEYWEQAKTNAALAVTEAEVFPDSEYASQSWAELFPDFTPTPLQTACVAKAISDGPELYVIEDATGAGKTEAALALTHKLLATGRAEGLFWGMPTMATSNALYGRVQALGERLFDQRGSMLLTHGNRALVELEGDETATSRASAWLADDNRRALLAHVSVGTIDQALLGALHSRHNVLRLFGLLGKVLVVDEVHACDTYMHGVLCTLLELHASAGSSVILLSATLPTEQRQELVNAWRRGSGLAEEQLSVDEYPLLTHVSASGITAQPIDIAVTRKRRVNVEALLNETAVVDRIIADAAAGNCVCWIRNTVRDALEGFDVLRQAMGERVMLFHARFTMGDRPSIEREVLRLFGKQSTHDDRSGWVLVATQVVEQSLDLDFDAMVSDLAPIDLLIQRVGRVHRHDRGERGNPLLHLHTPNPV